MFEVTLFLHSWLRWVVVVIAFMLMIKLTNSWLKKETWKGSEFSYLNGFLQIYNTQIAVGLALYFGLSPIPKAVIGDLDLIKNPYFFFFSLRHPISMILGVGIFQIGVALAKKRAAEKRYRILAITMILVLMVILSAIPWPNLDYGRNLFRWF